jgi:hypothetical protein
MISEETYNLIDPRHKFVKIKCLMTEAVSTMRIMSIIVGYDREDATKTRSIHGLVALWPDIALETVDLILGHDLGCALKLGAKIDPLEALMKKLKDMAVEPLSVTYSILLDQHKDHPIISSIQDELTAELKKGENPANLDELETIKRTRKAYCSAIARILLYATSRDIKPCEAARPAFDAIMKEIK